MEKIKWTINVYQTLITLLFIACYRLFTDKIDVNFKNTTQLNGWNFFNNITMQTKRRYFFLLSFQTNMYDSVGLICMQLIYMQT